MCLTKSWTRFGSSYYDLDRDLSNCFPHTPCHLHTYVSYPPTEELRATKGTETLPCEIIVHVMWQADVATLCKFKVVSKFFRQAAKHPLCHSLVFRLPPEPSRDLDAFRSFIMTENRRMHIRSLHIDIPDTSWNEAERRKVEKGLIDILTLTTQLNRLVITELDPDVTTTILSCGPDYNFRLTTLVIQPDTRETTTLPPDFNPPERSRAARMALEKFLISQQELVELTFHPRFLSFRNAWVDNIWNFEPFVISPGALPKLNRISGSIKAITELIAGRPITSVRVQSSPSVAHALHNLLGVRHLQLGRFYLYGLREIIKNETLRNLEVFLDSDLPHEDPARPFRERVLDAIYNMPYDWRVSSPRPLPATWGALFDMLVMSPGAPGDAFSSLDSLTLTAAGDSITVKYESAQWITISSPTFPNWTKMEKSKWERDRSFKGR